MSIHFIPFEDDEDLNFRTSAIIREFGEKILAQGSSPSKVDGEVLARLASTYAFLQRKMDGTSTSVTLNMFEPYMSMGGVTVEGKTLTFDDPNVFSKLVDAADVVDIYPLAADAVRLELGFYGLVKSAK